jgi:hypothetical protein
VHDDPGGGLTYTTTSSDNDGFKDQDLSFTGTIRDINKALSWVSYLSAPDTTGQTTLTITVSDNGHIGKGGAKQSTETITIDVENIANFSESPSYHTLSSSLDTSLASATIPPIDGDGLDTIYEMRVLEGSDANAGKILAVGAINDCLGLLRFNADLTLDPSFGANGNGIIQTEVDSGAHGRALTLDKHNNILVVGGNKIGRFKSDGTLDTDFGSNGYSDLASSPSTQGSMVPTDVVIQPDGRILVSYYVLGPIQSYNWAQNVAYAQNYFHIVRFTANGQIELEKSHDVGDRSTTTNNWHGDAAICP